MRSSLLALTIVAACSNNHAANPDAAVSRIDSPSPDASIVGTIADVRAAADGAIDIQLNDVTVTYVKPQVGDPAIDPAGFTIQTTQTGPAIFVAVDPSTLNLSPVAGDVITFIATQKATVSGQPHITAMTNPTRTSQGADLGALTQDISASTDLVSALGDYDSELVTVSGTLIGAVGSSGTGFSKFEIDTAGITTTPALQLRAPTALMNAIDMTTGCTITVTRVPFSMFVSTTTMNAEIGTFNTSEVALSGCAAPAVQKAVATAVRTIRVTFTRNIAANSIQADGSQFSIAGLTIAANPVVAGRTVTLTVTADQLPLTAYTVTVDNTVHPVKDLQGSTVATTLTANFLGYTTPATAVINEINATLGSSCDMIELRVVTDGSLGNFRLTERDGSTINYTFPASFQVHKNDFVIVHFGGTSATCNPVPAATDELTDPAGQLHASHTKNFDTAFDLYSTNTTGLIATSNVFTLYDPTDAIVDAVFATDTTTVAAGATLSQAAVVGTAVQWEPHATSYTDTDFRAAAVDNLSDTGSMQSTNSIQRINNTDTNAKADWTSGAGAAPTWGALNAGQTAFP